MYLDSKGKRKMSFIIGSTIALALLLLAVVLPEARITVTVEKKIFKQNYQFTLKQNLDKPLFALDILPQYTPEDSSKTNLPSVLIKDLDAFVTEENLTAFTIKKIQSEIQPNEKIDRENLKLTVTAADTEKRLVNVYVETTVSPVINLMPLKKLLKGKKTRDARNLLIQEPYVKNVQISLTPSWLFFIPLVKERIVIIEK